MKINDPQFIAGITQLSLGASSILLETGEELHTGIVYNSDYSSAYTDRSIITKSYVDSFVNSGEWTPTFYGQTDCTITNRKSLYSIRGELLNITCRFSFSKSTVSPPSVSTFRFSLPPGFQWSGSYNIHSDISFVNYNLYPGFQLSDQNVSYFNLGSSPDNQIIVEIIFRAALNNASTDMIIKSVLEVIPYP
jgi:hypothetical protein